MSTFLRQATCVARNVSRTRAFSSTTTARKDLVQDLYIREIRSYKPVPAAKDAHVGVVKSYTLPPAPKPPALPADLAAELSAYDATEPGAAAASTGATTTEAPTGADEFLTFLEQDLPKKEAHH